MTVSGGTSPDEGKERIRIYRRFTGVIYNPNCRRKDMV